MTVRSTRHLIAEALRAQVLEEESGFAGPNAALAELAAESNFDLLLEDIKYLRSGNTSERELHARILADCTLSPGRRVGELRRVLSDESNPKVIRWLVVGLGNAAVPVALPDLRRLAHHISSDVRFPVPDALSACAEDFDQVADVLLELSRDRDSDVRWSAAYELGAWWATRKDHRIADRLSVLGAADETKEVRDVAIAGLADGDECR